MTLRSEGSRKSIDEKKRTRERKENEVYIAEAQMMKRNRRSRMNAGYW